MNNLIQEWQREVFQSRICILLNDKSYIPGIDATVWTIIEEMANGCSDNCLLMRYPSLTRNDIRACQLFAYLRIIDLI